MLDYKLGLSNSSWSAQNENEYDSNKFIVEKALVIEIKHKF